MQRRAIQAPHVRLFAAAAALAAGFLFAPAALAGSADNVTGWAWSGSIGWVSMNCTNTASCGTVNFGVTINDSTTCGDCGDLVGWAWSETLGWICFGSTCGGMAPDGLPAIAQYRANYNGKVDQFWGWAQVQNMGSEGWIALNCDHDGTLPDDCAASNHYVILNNANGNFNGGNPVVPDHWAWGVNTAGVGVGWVDMSGINTSWTLAKLGLIKRPGGVYEPVTAYSAFACSTDADCSTHAPHTQCEKIHNASFSCASDTDCVSAPYTRCDVAAGKCYTTDKCMLPGTHLGHKFQVRFEGFSGALNQFLECEFLLPDTTRRIVNKVLTTAIRNGVTTLDYIIQPSDPLQANKIWYLDVCRVAGSALGASCTDAGCLLAGTCDANCGAGKICDESAGKCRTVIEQSDKRKPVYTHGNAWTGLNASQDQYLAIKCNAGFPNNYFKNAAQCDFTGDASFALAMRRGIPLEGDCGDLIDNDGNGQVDCADRYCKGISYRCQTLQRTLCEYGHPDAPLPPVGTGDGMPDCSDAGYTNGDLCCSRQPHTAGAALSHIVDGLECTHGDPADGYFDCDCDASRYNICQPPLGPVGNACTSSADCTGYPCGPNPDCYAPGYQTGDLCCDATNQVVKQ